MPQSAPYLDLFRAQFGARRKVTREQLRQFLILLSTEAGLDIRGHAGWYGAREDDAPENIARCIANTPYSLSLLSLGGHVRDIQYDSPGTMNPSQHAELSFVSEDLARGRHDADPTNCPGSTMEYLRRHAARVIVVTGEQIQPPPKPVPPPHKSSYYCPRCNEERYVEDHGDATMCPTCRTAIGQLYL